MLDISLDPLSEFPCPHCGIALEVKEKAPFSPISCPQCGKKTTVPGLFGPFYLLRLRDESVTGILADAYDPKLGRAISLKILSSILSKNNDVVAAFKKEALAAASINSQYVIKVYQFGVHNRQPYMVMEPIEGEFLNEVLKRGPVEQAKAIHLAEGIVLGLQDLHQQGIIQGDVMPRNLLLHKDGGIRISNFGLAWDNDQRATDPTSWSSPYYMPPERIRGEPEDFRGDFYSLGTTLFYMVTGCLPFFDVDEDLAKEKKLRVDAPDPLEQNPDLHESVVQVLRALLQQHPEDRPGSFEEVLEQLATSAAQFGEIEKTPPLPPPEIPKEEPPKKQSRREAITWFVFLTLAGVCTAVVLSMLTNRTKKEVPLPENPALALPISTPAPTPTPRPTATPSPTPRPTATPTPSPSPTPTPRPIPTPSSFTSLVEEHIYLRPPEVQSDWPMVEWKQKDKVIFQQAAMQLQPSVQQPEGVPHRVISFAGHQMLSGLDPTRWEECTLILVADVQTPPESVSQMIVGIPPHSSEWTPFGLFTSPTLPGVFTIRTENGNVTVSVPRNRRGKPFVFAYRKSTQGQDVFLAGRRIPLPMTPQEPPILEGGHLLTLHLGGGSDPEHPFYGWIGSVFIAETALPDQDLAVIIQKFRDLYTIEP